MSSHFKEGTDKKAEEGKKKNPTIQRGQASSSFQWQI